MPRLPNGKVDEAPDCYFVDRTGAGVFHVTHFRHAGTKTACCAMELTRSALDIETARAEGIDVDIVTLRRTPACSKARKR